MKEFRSIAAVNGFQTGEHNTGLDMGDQRHPRLLLVLYYEQGIPHVRGATGRQGQRHVDCSG